MSQGDLGGSQQPGGSPLGGRPAVRLAQVKRPGEAVADPRRFYVEVEYQGRLVKPSVRLVERSEEQGPGQILKRGSVTEFSRRSRKRLMESTNRIDAAVFCDPHAERPKFLTLTYGASYPGAAEAKRHLRTFLEILRRRWRDSSGFWRIEYQQRGAPHFHLVLFGLPFLPFEVLRAWWERVIGWDTSKENNDHVFIRIEEIKSYKALTCYVSKYCAKMPEKPGAGSLLDSVPYLHEGRWWGIYNRSKIPWAALHKAKIPFGPWWFQCKRAARGIYKKIRNQRNKLLGYTLFLNDARKYYEFMLSSFMASANEYRAEF